MAQTGISRQIDRCEQLTAAIQRLEVGEIVQSFETRDRLHITPIRHAVDLSHGQRLLLGDDAVEIGIGELQTQYPKLPVGNRIGHIGRVDQPVVVRAGGQTERQAPKRQNRKSVLFMVGR